MKTLRVLIVEDHRDTAEALAKWVSTAGHEVQVCHTGFQAEDCARGFHPDIVLLDIGLPDMYGTELARLLRRENPDVKLAAVTAYQSSDDRRKSREAGIDLHFGKPIQMEVLSRLLDSVATC